MADYSKVIERFPTMRIYMNANTMARRGEVDYYRPRMQNRVLTTDNYGFRRSVYNGEFLVPARCGTLEGVDVLLGSSHVFGIGAESDRETMASQLSHFTNRPVAAINLPEANTKDLIGAATHSINPKILRRMYLFPGGSFSRFCITGLASPMDGPPTSHAYPKEELARRQSSVDEQDMFDNLVRYQLRTIRHAQKFAEGRDLELVVVQECSFFEKETPTPYEKEAELGESQAEAQEKRFMRHRTYAKAYNSDVFGPLANENIRVVTYPSAQDIEFIDEFHPTPDSVVKIAKKIAGELA